MFVYVMEYLSNEHFTHLNTADDISGWTTADIKVLTPLSLPVHYSPIVSTVMPTH